MRIAHCISGLVITVAALLLMGCQTQRPAVAIQRDADFHFDRGNYEEAAALYAEIADRYPGDWRAQYQLGRAALEIDRPREAHRALEIAHTLRPRDEGTVDALAEALLASEQHDRLFTLLTGHAEQTRSRRAYERLGEYAVELGDYDTAKVAYTTAIEIDQGQSVEPYLAAADFNQRIGDLDAAVHRLRQAYAINPLDKRVIDQLKALGEVPGPTIAMPPSR